MSNPERDHDSRHRLTHTPTETCIRCGSDDVERGRHMVTLEDFPPETMPGTGGLLWSGNLCAECDRLVSRVLSGEEWVPVWTGEDNADTDAEGES